MVYLYNEIVLFKNEIWNSQVNGCIEKNIILSKVTLIQKDR